MRIGVVPPALGLLLALTSCSAADGVQPSPSVQGGSNPQGADSGDNTATPTEILSPNDANAQGNEKETALGAGGSGSDGGIYIPPNSNNQARRDYLYCEYKTLEEDDTTFKGEITIGNANTEYVWNGYSFTVWSVDFTTTSKITLVGLDEYNIVKYSQEEDTLKIDMGDNKYFPSEFRQNTLVTIQVEGIKGGRYPYPARCTPDYVRGDIVYPVYENLPRTWWKGKPSIVTDDLIVSKDDYYEKEATATKEGVFIYNPVHNTQIIIGQPDGVGYKINGFDNVIIRVPNTMMAMGLALSYEWFKFNPNYFCALGSKENDACGFVAVDDPQAGAGATIVNINGERLKSYAKFTDTSQSTTDGPFQQEEVNFIALARIFPDYFTSEESHATFVSVSSTPNDPKWASAVITSALSSVSTRENLWALKDGDYSRIVFDAVDPMAELGVITYTYNRGIFGFCGTGIMGSLDDFVKSKDTITDYGLTGVNFHVPSIRAITMAMNSETTNVYDAELTWGEVDAFLQVVHMFYARGYPTKTEWAGMRKDVKGAFDALATHWGGNTVRYRYDFLTLLRVLKQHLKTPTVPRPTTEYWRFIAQNIPC